MLTDDPVLLRAAEKHYSDFLVPTSRVEAKKSKRYYTPQQQADLDGKTSENLIGDIINLGQELNSMIWDALNGGASFDEVMPIYQDAVQLDIMSGIEIDKAKKEFTISNGVELRKMRKKYERLSEEGKKIKPYFFAFLARQKGYFDPDKKAYKKHLTSMDFLHAVVNSYVSRGIRAPLPTLPFSKIIDQSKYNSQQVNRHQISRIIHLVQDTDAQIRAIWGDPHSPLSIDQKKQAAEELRERCSDYISGITLDTNTMIRLLRLIEEPDNKKIRRRLFHILFGKPSASFYRVLIESRTPVACLEESTDGEIELFGLKYRSKTSDFMQK